MGLGLEGAEVRSVTSMRKKVLWVLMACQILSFRASFEICVGWQDHDHSSGHVRICRSK
jgi:hypothetical protein